MEVNSTVWYLGTKQLERWVYLHNAFTVEECELIKNIGNKLELTDGNIFDNDSSTFNKTIRSSKINNLNSSKEENAWIFKKCTDLVTTINSEFWNFDLEYISNLQYTVYGSLGDHYDFHIDTLPSNPQYRKLSFTILLDDPADFTGGNLEIIDSVTPVNTNAKQGTIIFFPSFMMHRVTPITSGTRRSLVGWVCGPQFR
jgi:PKHD-type hydroxylase